MFLYSLNYKCSIVQRRKMKWHHVCWNRSIFDVLQMLFRKSEVSVIDTFCSFVMIFISSTKSEIKSILKKRLNRWMTSVHIKFRSKKRIQRIDSRARFRWKSYSQSMFLSKRSSLIWPEDSALKQIVETDSCVNKIEFIAFQLLNSRASW